MLPKEDRISYKAMLEIPLSRYMLPKENRILKLKTFHFQVYAKPDVRHSTSRYMIPKEDRIS